MRWISSGIYLLVLSTCYIGFVGTEEICGVSYQLPKWEPMDSAVPGFLRLGIINVTLDISNPVSALGIQVENRTENVTLTLLANPFVTNENCPNVSSNYAHLRKFHDSYNITVGGNERETFYFAKIFTGCYYAEMTNAEGKKWIWAPRFYSTNYSYHDTMLKCQASKIVPEDSDKSMRLRFVLEIPQNCFKLECQLFELYKINEEFMEGLYSENIPPAQTCWVMKSNNKTVTPECTRPDSNLTLTSSFHHMPDKPSERWGVVVEWNNLKRGHVYYYAKIRQHSQNCAIGHAELFTWQPTATFGAIFHAGLHNASNAAPSEPSDFLHSKNFKTILYILLGVILTAILIFWVSKYGKLVIARRQGTIKSFEKFQEIVKLTEQMESNRILLIYANESPEFMKAMEAFRDRLQYSCNVIICDVYSNEDWNMVSKLGATTWVEDVLKEGTKVVWVDTPKFRSDIDDYKSQNGTENHFYPRDFRDEAIPYAVQVAINLFQNVTTQYCRHFVVRFDGFKVDDGPHDPLLVVSPHVRYFIPAHLARLCEDLVK